MTGLQRVARWLGVAALCAVATAIPSGEAEADLWDRDYFTNAPLVTQDGETVRFYDDLIADKIVVVSFIYTDCPDICGLSTARLAQIVDWLGARVGQDIFVYSISIDPETDTPERLKSYAAAFGAENREGWTFLTGTRADIDVVRHKLGERSRFLGEHRSDMVIGNGSTGQWRRTSLMGSLVVATTEILELDPTYIPPKPVLASLSDAPEEPLVIRNTRGEGMFITACAACHTIGDGVRVGPDLAGVTLRRDRDWLKRYLQDPDQMLATHDPVAMALDAEFPDVIMPDLGLEAADASDLIHYLEARTVALGAPMTEMPSHDDHDHDHDHGAAHDDHADHGDHAALDDHAAHADHADHSEHDTHADHH
ncbi:SCO family protein [uncultured Jannaschia sp.]|uniref:SCO family protein n=1 Tax=uncultured Jannaschia sp. TaxID=293347 RepID=UPI00262364C0|nr:SCO family protein [uncultured Jannaschia sp.]